MSKQLNFSCKLISIADKTIPNVNGTLYRPCTISFIDKDGKEAVRKALMYENNFQYGVKSGQELLATAKQTDKGVLITVSHLAGSGAAATVNDFNWTNAEEVQAPSKESLKVK